MHCLPFVDLLLVSLFACQLAHIYHISYICIEFCRVACIQQQVLKSRLVIYFSFRLKHKTIVTRQRLGLDLNASETHLTPSPMNMTGGKQQPHSYMPIRGHLTCLFNVMLFELTCRCPIVNLIYISKHYSSSVPMVEAAFKLTTIS